MRPPPTDLPPAAAPRVWATDFHDQVWAWVRHDSLSLFIGVVAGIALYSLFVGLRTWTGGWLRRRALAGGWRWTVLRVIERTRSFFLLLAAARVVVGLAEAPPTFEGVVRFLFTVAAAIQGGLWVRELLLSLVERRAIAHQEDQSFASALGIISILVSVAVWALVAIVLLDNLGVNITALVAGLGIGGIAIGLAAQGIFSDLFAALSILLDKPFARGDMIQFGQTTARVEAIGLKSTRLRALSGELLVMSNRQLLDQLIANFADYPRRRQVLNPGVLYQTPPETIARLPAEMEAIVRARSLCTFDRAHFTGFGESSLDFELVFFVESGDYAVMMDERQAVSLAILRRFAELEVEFAYPSRTLFLSRPDGQAWDPARLAPPAAAP